MNVDLAWNFFMTAEHLPDWVYYQDMPISGKPRPDLLDGQTPYEFKMDRARPFLRICSHLANGGKHLHLRNTNLTSVGDTLRENTSFVEPGFVEKGFFAEEPVLWVSLAYDEQKALGRDKPNVYAIWLATRVLEFWRLRRLT